MKGKIRISAGQLIVWLLLAAVIVLAIIYRDDISVDSVVRLVPDNLLLAFAVFMLLYAGLSVSVVIPMVILYVSSGLIFGSYTALIVNLCGGAVCITLPYLLGRYSSVGILEKAKEKLPAVVTDYLAAHPMGAFRKNVILRAIGIVPSCTVSYYMGSVGESFTGYFFGSLIGFLPDLIPQTLIGVSVTDPRSSLFIISLCVALVLKAAAITLSLLLKKRRSTDEL